ncbi:MAG: site-specific DNA-methyltransferase, partial [Dehalococcoidia bacterium]|nr:site-specific DNA-methyltransferase [Dehalococcoidia bacterium]
MDNEKQIAEILTGIYGNRLICGEVIGRYDSHVSDRDAKMQVRLLHVDMTSEPMLKDKPRLVSDWDYRTANTKEYTHGIHPYPAMMIPQVARRLIQEYGYPGGILFDPYCGTGTTLLEAFLVGRESVGTDLNPLARLIAKVKTTPIDIIQLDLALERFVDFEIDAVTSSNGRVETPDFPNVDYWFDSRVQRELTLIREYIDLIDDTLIADFFRVAFSLTVRKTSWAKNSEFKLVRIPPESMKDHNPDVFSTMVSILTCSRDAVLQLNNTPDQSVPLPSIYGFNSVAGVPENVIEHDSVDLIVTSPPYGDSRTTVAYGQFSRLSSQWLGYEDASRIDNELMGGSKDQGDVSFEYEALDSTIRKIANANPKRSREVAALFGEYGASLMNVWGGGVG